MASPDSSRIHHKDHPSTHDQFLPRHGHRFRGRASTTTKFRTLAARQEWVRHARLSDSVLLRVPFPKLGSEFETRKWSIVNVGVRNAKRSRRVQASRNNCR